jgi:hypothetical protein
MEDPPPFASVAPIAYRGIDTNVARPRPGGVTAISILGIVSGALQALVSGSLTFRYVSILFLIHRNRNLQFFTPRYILFRQYWMGLSIYILTAALALLIIAASIGSLRLAHWARRGMLVWAVAFLALTPLWVLFRLLVFRRRFFSMPTAFEVMSSDWPRMSGIILAAAIFPVFTSLRARSAFIRPRGRDGR